MKYKYLGSVIGGRSKVKQQRWAVQETSAPVCEEKNWLKAS